MNTSDEQENIRLPQKNNVSMLGFYATLVCMCPHVKYFQEQDTTCVSATEGRFQSMEDFCNKQGCTWLGQWGHVALNLTVVGSSPGLE